MLCYNKTMQQPNILYTAVKALIKNEQGKVLVLRQADPTMTGYNQYHLPGGIVELGESVRDNLAREVYEELGVQGSVGRLIDVGEWFARRDDDVMQFIGLFFECQIKTADFVLQKAEVDHACWVGQDDIDTTDILEPSKSIMRQYLQTDEA